MRSKDGGFLRPRSGGSRRQTRPFASTNPAPNVFSAFGLFLAGALCALAALVELSRTRHLVRVGKDARARLIPGKTGPEDDGDQEPPPMLQFRTEDGLEIKIAEATPSKGEGSRPGTEVVVVYDPNNPYLARRKAFTQLWAPGLLWLTFAFILAALGLVSQIFGDAGERAEKTIPAGAVKIVFIEQDS